MKHFYDVTKFSQSFSKETSKPHDSLIYMKSQKNRNASSCLQFKQQNVSQFLYNNEWFPGEDLSQVFT